MSRLRERLSDEGGTEIPRIFVKREDMTGLAFGGNKARHYEFEMPHVVNEGYDTLINIMDYHSNNARMTAAAANKAGLRYVPDSQECRPSKGARQPASRQAVGSGNASA